MLYEITLTLRPQMYRHDSKVQYEQTKALLDDVFNRGSLKDPSRCSIIAELTQEDNIHYHGIVDLKDFQARHRLIERIRRHNKVFGKKTLSQIVNYPTWVAYINKAKTVTRGIIGDPVVYDDHNVLCDEQFRQLAVPDTD